MFVQRIHLPAAYQLTSYSSHVATKPFKRSWRSLTNLSISLSFEKLRSPLATNKVIVAIIRKELQACNIRCQSFLVWYLIYCSAPKPLFSAPITGTPLQKRVAQQLVSQGQGTNLLSQAA